MQGERVEVRVFVGCPHLELWAAVTKVEVAGLMPGVYGTARREGVASEWYQVRMKHHVGEACGRGASTCSKPPRMCSTAKVHRAVGLEARTTRASPDRVTVRVDQISVSPKM